LSGSRGGRCNSGDKFERARGRDQGANQDEDQGDDHDARDRAATGKAHEADYCMHTLVDALAMRGREMSGTEYR
jgi:hypothetical protein